ncbi:MAG TPA: substrate-binding domain-containing protein [Chthoniobacterales bacterium]
MIPTTENWRPMFKRFHGVGLIAPDHPVVREGIRELVAGNVPVRTMVTDIPNVPRVGYVGIDNRASGRLAGHLLGRFLYPGPHKVALIAGSLGYRGHEEREMGFRHILAEVFPKLEVVELRENFDDFRRAYEQTNSVLDEHPDLGGIYNIGAGNRGIASALEERSCARDFPREYSLALNDATVSFQLMGLHLYRTSTGLVLRAGDQYFQGPDGELDDVLNRPFLTEQMSKFVRTAPEVRPPSPDDLLPPIGSQEVWAAGVTYERSREGRREEARESGAAVFYTRVYEAERPELFFKAAGWRAVGPGGAIRIRQDAVWNVPEPELAVIINSQAEIVGYTVGNDVSSRDIEGENPLYLPQAKVYDGSCALGPAIYLTPEPLDLDSEVRLTIERGAGEVAFAGQVALSRIKRSFADLAECLFAELTFPVGAFLLTGTGIVPPNHFTLQPGDVVRIAIDPIGELVNRVAQEEPRPKHP